MTCVSFVIPTYNRQKYLHASVRSIREQRAAPVEILVVDDASDEPCRPRFEGDPLFSGVVWLRHECNRGPGHARRTGVAAASGRYVGFLDDDDVLEPRHLERALAVLESDRTVGLFCCDATLIDDSGTALEGERTFNGVAAAIKKYPLASGVRSLDAVFEFPTLGMGFLVRREVFERVAYPANRRLEDYEFQLNVAANGFGVYYCHEPLARYRMHQRNASRGHGVPAMAEQVLVTIRLAVDRYPALGQSPDRVRRRVADAETDLGIACLRDGQISRGVAALARAVTGDPRRITDLARIAWRWGVGRVERALRG